tara:strand:- start:187 stop:336 length:150 start_codon:yes stop_codon:yes gene_type:complete
MVINTSLSVEDKSYEAFKDLPANRHFVRFGIANWRCGTFGSLPRHLEKR